MKKYSVLIGLLVWQTSTAQVNISNVAAVPHASAMLQVDVGSASGQPKGLLIPRLSQSQESQLAGNGPADGLMYFSTARNKFMYLRNSVPLMINPWRVNADSSRLIFSRTGARVGIGNSNPTETLDVTGNVKVSGTITGTGTIPLGGIIMWSGLLTDIPTGWKLCNGQPGTPDLRGRFIISYDDRTGGALPPHSATYAMGAAGGNKTHNHTATAATAPDHNHDLPVLGGLIVGNTAGLPDPPQNYSVYDVSSGGGENGSWTGSWRLTVGSHVNDQDEGQHRHSQEGPTADGGSHTHALTVAQTDHRPPYYVLAFIIRRD